MYGTTSGGIYGDEGLVFEAIVGASAVGESSLSGPMDGSATATATVTDTLAMSINAQATAIGASTTAASSGIAGYASAAGITGASTSASSGLVMSAPAAGIEAVMAAQSLGMSSDIVASAISTGATLANLRLTTQADARATVTSSPAFSLAMASDIVAKATEDPPFIKAQSPELAPLQQSYEADSLERELKQIVMGLFEDHLRDGERYVNALGMPQLGARELVEAALAGNGIPIHRGASVAESAGAYLLRAWLSRNPKRGLHMLKHMLQMLWPNAATVNQMWQDKAAAYPTALVDADGGNHYLTSRVQVSLPARVTTGSDVAAIQSGLKACLPARMMLTLTIEEQAAFDFGLTNVYYQGCVAQSYTGSFN